MEREEREREGETETGRDRQQLPSPGFSRGNTPALDSLKLQTLAITTWLVNSSAAGARRWNAKLQVV